MSEFSVGINQIETEQQAIAACSATIGRIVGTLDSMDISLGGYSLRDSFSKVRSDVSKEASAVGKTAETLGIILGLYTATENMSAQDTQMISAYDYAQVQNTVQNDENPSEDDHGKDADIASSIGHGLFGYGIATIGTILENYVTDLGADAIAAGIYAWMQQNFPTLFMDRGMVLALAGGGEALLGETPSWLASIVRAGSKWLVPVIGTAIDFGVQIWQGEEAKDAAVKAGAHTLIGIGAHAGGAAIGAKIGGAIGSVVPGAGTAIGIAAGAVIGAAGSVAFDYVYDNWDDISGWVGDRVQDAGNWIGERAEDFGNWASDTGAAVGSFFEGIGNAFSFSW